MYIVKVKCDLSGKKFNRLLVISQTDDYVKPNGKRESKWKCLCDCGNYIDVLGYQLKNGHTKSCGCLTIEKARINGKNTKNLIPNQKKYNTYIEKDDYIIGYTSNNQSFYISKQDYDKIKNVCWYIDGLGYVSNRSVGSLHRFILEPKDNLYVDHINHNKLDNRRINLRIVTPSQNGMNRIKQSNNTSGITGVTFHKPSKRWCAIIKDKGKQIRQYANSKDEAIEKRKQLENLLFKEYSYKNSIGG